MYGENQVSVTTLKEINLKERLEQNKIHHEKCLSEINETLALLEENPDLAKVIEVLQKSRYL